MHDTVFSSREDRENGLDLRAVRFGDDEVFSRISFAARDPLWRTLDLEIVHRTRRSTPTGFELEATARTTDPRYPLEVALRYEANGHELVVGFEAVAGGDFEYCRIGFNVLFGDEAYRGRSAWTWRAGARTDLSFPVELITHDQHDAASERFHRPFDRLSTTLATGTRVDLVAEGELFEFEDQRNWTDASYKAYSVSTGWPFRATAGRRFGHALRVTARAGSDSASRGTDPAIRLGDPIGPLPTIGLFRERLSPRSLRPGGGFQELNAQRRADVSAFDSIELAVNGAVHAADDDSVMETPSQHGAIAAQARRLHPGLPVRLAPVSFADVAGDWRDASGAYSPEPPDDLPAERLGTDFAATWLIASVAHAVTGHPEGLAYFGPRLHPDAPAARELERLAGLADATVLAVEAPAPLAVLALAVDRGITVAVANTGPDAHGYVLPDGRSGIVRGHSHVWHELAASGVVDEASVDAVG